MVLWLARHAHTAWNGPPRRLQGRTDVGLSAQGWAEAARWGAALPPPALIVASPARRCRETITAAFPDAPRVEVDPRLWEMDNGDFAGLTEPEVFARHPVEWLRWRTRPSSVRLGGGETLAEVRARVVAALAGLEDGPDPTLVMTHGGPIRTLLCPDLDDVHEIEVGNLALFTMTKHGLVPRPVADLRAVA